MKDCGKGLTLLLIIALLNIELNAQDVNADFFAQTVSGCSPLSVSFTNTSTPETGVTYYWDFGNNTFSTLKNPSVIYLEPGKYTVTLIVTDGIESDTLKRIDYINSFSSPQATFSLNGNQNGCSPYNVSFEANLSQNTEIVTYWLWDFGDGSFSELENPDHTFVDDGSYAVSLYLEDNKGCSSIYTLNDAVIVHAPKANFSADKLFSCDDTLTANFNNLSDLSNLQSFLWLFGDDSVSVEVNPHHDYIKPGEYDVSLVVNDIYGCSDTLTKIKYISNQSVKAAYRTSASVICADDSAKFTNLSVNATKYLWNFDEGATSTEKNPVHVFTEGRTHEISLIAYNDKGCYDTAVSEIEVEKVVAFFTIDNNFSCSVPDTFSYTNQTQNADYYVWHFGNGNSSFAINPTNIVNQAGYYSDTLFAVSSNGCKDTYVLDSAARIVIPWASFSPNMWIRPYDRMGCVPNTVDFKDETYYPTNYDEIVSWNWDFDDGEFSTEKDPYHTFTTLDTFYVTMTVTTALGCTSEYSSFAYTGTRQHADFISNATDTICASTPIQFLNTSTNSELVNNSYWIFSDSTTSTERDPLVFFSDTGYIDVKLLVFHNGCPDDTLIENYVYVKGPYQDIQAENNCLNPYEVSFYGNIVDATYFRWDFGDGSEQDSVNLNPVHTYPETGFYTVTLYSYNENNQCSYSSVKIIEIKDVKSSFTVSDDKICTNSTISFNSSNSDDYDIFYYLDRNCFFVWDFGDSTNNLATTDTIISHYFEDEGDYTVKLIVKNYLGCADTMTKVINVHKPNVDISVDNNFGCTPSSFNFSDNSVSDYSLISHFWEFGDGATSDEVNPSHVYSSNGSYNIILKLTDNQGCSAVDTFKNFVKVHRPVPVFSVEKTNLCENDEIKFTYVEQTDSILSVLWNFGDGFTSTEKTPVHQYIDSGSYFVSLTLVDTNMCDSSILLNDYINVQSAPQPDFIADTTSSNCFPLLVKFSDETSYNQPYSRLWTFSNTSKSTLPNPAYTYTKPGDYNVSLKVTSSNGCSATEIKTNFISIQGPYCEMVVPDSVCRFADNLYSLENMQNISSLQWFMGNGATFFDTTFNFSYDISQTYYPIVLLKTDSVNTCNKLFYKPVVVRKINSGFMSSQGNAGCVPFEVILSDTTLNKSYRIWDFGSPSDDNSDVIYHSFEQSGQFDVTMYETDIFGCKDTSVQSFIIHALPDVKASQDTILCLNSSLELNASGARDYVWYPNEFIDNNHSPKPIVNPTQNIQYQVEGTDSNGCSNYASTYIEVIQLPVFNVKDTAIVIGDTIIVNNYSEDILTYNWWPNQGIDCENCSNIRVSPLEQTTYYLTITDTAGCFELTKSFDIDVYLKYSIDVPDAFTPNGDNINDVIYVDGWGIKELVYFKIYNRYGEMVFSTTDKNQGWDGIYKGKVQPVETYRYTAAVLSYDGQVRTKSGTIKIIY